MTDTFDIIPAPATIQQVRRVLPTDSQELVAEKVMLLECIAEWVKTTRADFEASLKEYIEERGPVRVGEILYFVAPVKKPPKCCDVPAAVEALLTATGGDFGKFCEHLSSGAVKYGAAKQTLPPEEYERLFKVEEVEELQSDEVGKATKKLQKMNPSFVRAR